MPLAPTCAANASAHRSNAARNASSRTNPAALRAGYLTQHAALATAGGDVVGGFVVLRAHDALSGGVVGVRRSLLAAGALGLLPALSAAVSALLARMGCARRPARGSATGQRPLPP